MSDWQLISDEIVADDSKREKESQCSWWMPMNITQNAVWDVWIVANSSLRVSGSPLHWMLGSDESAVANTEQENKKRKRRERARERDSKKEPGEGGDSQTQSKDEWKYVEKKRPTVKKRWVINIDSKRVGGFIFKFLTLVKFSHEILISRSNLQFCFQWFSNDWLNYSWSNLDFPPCDQSNHSLKRLAISKFQIQFQS